VELEHAVDEIGQLAGFDVRRLLARQLGLEQGVVRVVDIVDIVDVVDVVDVVRVVAGAADIAAGQQDEGRKDKNEEFFHGFLLVRSSVPPIPARATCFPFQLDNHENPTYVSPVFAEGNSR